MQYQPLHLQQADELKRVALQSWLHTYKDIYSNQFIIDFVDEHYSFASIKNALEWASTNNGWNYAALDNNKLVGYITIGPANGTFRLWRIYLLPEYIGKGIGSKLLSLGEAFLQSQKATSYFALVHKNNMAGIHFYTRKGFKPIFEKNESDDLYFEKKFR